MSVESVLAEAVALAERNVGPVGVSVLVCTDDPDVAREVAPRLAALLYPGRHFGAVLHVEPADPPDHWPSARHLHGHTAAWTEAVVEEVRAGWSAPRSMSTKPSTPTPYERGRMTPTTGTLSIDARWVCVDCGSENIEEHGTVLEVTPLAGAIETDPEMGGPVASPMLEGEIIYDSYNPTGYACRECGRSEEALGALVKLWQPAPEGWPGS